MELLKNAIKAFLNSRLVSAIRSSLRRLSEPEPTKFYVVMQFDKTSWRDAHIHVVCEKLGPFTRRDAEYYLKSIKPSRFDTTYELKIMTREEIKSFEMQVALENVA